MPLVEVELVGGPEAVAGLATPLADAVGSALDARVGGTWVRVRHLPPERYGESGGVPEGLRPVLVRLVLSRHPSDVASVLRGVAAAVAEVTGRPVENVHVVLEPEGAGRIAFGGRLPE
jgi:phenylpyruvate tautomerase PptA (4-oxalocrotonate tautomerase family)